MKQKTISVKGGSLSIPKSTSVCYCICSLGPTEFPGFAHGSCHFLPSKATGLAWVKDAQVYILGTSGQGKSLTGNPRKNTDES